MPASPQAYLRRHGLKPLKWDEVLRAVETRLPPPDRALFLRRHRNFTSYPAEQTCRAFYDFIGARGLTDLLASFRFHRLCRLGDCLSSLSLRGRSVLDLGAGGGYLSGYLREELGADVSLTDWSPESLRCLKEMDFKTFTGPAYAELQGRCESLALCAYPAPFAIIFFVLLVQTTSWARWHRQPYFLEVAWIVVTSAVSSDFLK